MVAMKAYEEAIRARVCVNCLQRTGRGICGTGAWEDCALNRYLPDIINVVRAIPDGDLHDYVHELHNVICVSCRDNASGICGLRETHDCPLDEYFPLAVQAILAVKLEAHS